MDRSKILLKFGKDYQVNDATYVMGIHHVLADHIASRFRGCRVVLDTNAGAGFASIALAGYVDRVVSVEINPEHLAQAKHNVKLSGVSSKFEFILGDIMDDKVIASLPEIDGALLDPDWAPAGRDKHSHVSKIAEMQPAGDKLFFKIFEKTPNISFRLPRELDLQELKGFPDYELELLYLNGDLKFYNAYFGKLIKKNGLSEFREIIK